MKEFKRRLAIVLAACMVLTNVMPAFAEEEITPVIQEEITCDSSVSCASESEIEEATQEEALYEDIEIENDIEEASPSEEYAFISETIVDGVKIRITADEGVFPDNAELYAAKVEDAETEEAIDEAVENEKSEEEADKNVASNLKFDIKMLVDGEEIQPDTTKGKVYVSFEVEKHLNDFMDVNVYHIKEDPDSEEITGATVLDSEVENVEISDDSEAEKTVVVAETNGFSYYVVEFTYWWLDYAIQPNKEVRLVEILSKLGISGTILSATVSDAEQIKLNKSDSSSDNWTIKVIEPFTGFEWGFEWLSVEVEDEDDEDDTDEYDILITIDRNPDHDYRSEMLPIANHLYEVEYYNWNAKKANAIAELISKANLKTTPTDSNDFDIDPDKLSDKAKELYEKLLNGGLWEEFKQGMLEALGTALCTSCRTGDLIGRNFDWTYDDVDEFVIRVPATEKRHASIGVASAFFPTFLQELIGVDDIIPMLTMDGINDQGVAINVNVVVGDPEVSGDTTGTKKGPKKGPKQDTDNLCAGFVVRYILDNANSAEHAVELLKKSNLFSVITQEFHWMISDSKETYIVETVNNSLSILKSKGKKAAMSNFHVSHSERCKEYNRHLGQNEKDYSQAEEYDQGEELKFSFSDLYFLYPMGIERYNIVSENLDSVKSEEAMMNNMRKAWYLQGLYHPGNERFWSDHNFYPDDNGDKFTYYDPDTRRADRQKTFDAAVETYKWVKEIEEETGERMPGAVQTVHTAVYNIAKKTLMVNVQERKTNFEFALKDSIGANLTTMYVNGDNVGAAKKCDVPGERWSYNPASKVLTLLDNDGTYNINSTGDNGITIQRSSSNNRHSSGNGGGGGSVAGGPSTITFSQFWKQDASGFWYVINNKGETIKNAWLCDDAVLGNGKNAWYLLGADGRMLTAGLVQDNTGNFYSLETTHAGLFGMLRYKDGFYDCNGQAVYLKFSQKHDGTYGAVINPEGLEKLKAIYGITKYNVGNENAVYTSTFN